MNYLKRPLGLSFLLLSIILGAQVGLKKPLCISSKIVNKIDILEAHKISTIYNCTENRKTTYSDYFFKNSQDIEGQLMSLERILQAFDIMQPISIQIDLQQKKAFQKKIEGLHLGEDFLQSRAFEKAIFQYLLENKLGIQDQIFYETLADFYISDGNFQNPISKIWFSYFENMNVFEKQKIKSELAKLLSHETIENLGSSEKNILNTLKILGLNRSAESQLVQKIKNHTADHVVLDLIIDISKSKHQFEELKLMALKNTSVKIGIKDSKGLKIYPIGKLVSSKIENQIRTNFRVIFLDQSEFEKNLLSYHDNTEKLVIINDSNSDSLIRSEALLKSDIKQFLYWNKQFEFVQIHLPSYRLKAQELSKVKNFFDFLKSRDFHSHETKALGWSKIEWSDDLRAYKPIANFDVIQYFRVN